MEVIREGETSEWMEGAERGDGKAASGTGSVGPAKRGEIAGE